MSSPGIRRSGRARTQVHSLYDEAREQAQKEEDERSAASSESPKSPSPRRRSKSAGAAGNGKGKAKAKAKLQQQQHRRRQQEEEVEESSDDDGSVASAGAGKKRKRAPPAAKGKGKGKGRKAPAKKAAAAAEESSDNDDSSAASEAEIDKLMDERPKGKGKGGKAAPVNRLKEGPKTSVLFEHIARRLPVESRMRRWVSDWLEEAEEEEAEAEGGGPCVIDMFNFLLFSAGATKAYANRETELLPEVDSAEWEALMGGVVQDLREGGVPNYPLLEKSAKFKGFRERFAQAWAALVVGARDGNGHHLDALRRVLEVIHGLCECPLVSVRHTACYAGLQIGEALVKETVTLSTKIDVAARQLEAERRKAAAAGANAKGQGRKARDLERNIEEFTAHLGELEAVLEEVFNSIFATRYRDVNERVRVHCLDGLGAFVARYPAMFLKDQFIKYLGWMLYDKADAVRAAAARVLLQLYAKPSNVLKLENFTARFLGRMLGLVQDVDEGVRVLAVRILRHLLAAGYLDEAEQEQLDEVDELLLDPTWGLPLRAEAMLFFADHVEGFNEGEDEEEEQEQEESDEEEEDDDEEEEGGGAGKGKGKAKAAARRSSAASKKKGGRQSTGSAAAAKGGGARARRAVMQRLVTVVQFLDYHLKPGVNPDAEEGEEEEEDDGAERPWPEAYDRLVATCVESFERHPQGGFLYDWPTYFALLKDPAGPTARADVAGGLTDREQSLLIRLMAAAVKRAAAADGGGGGWVQAEALKAKEPPSVTSAAAPTGKAAAAGGTVTAAERAAARKQQEGLKTALEAFTSGAVEELPKVLRRYKTDGSKLAGLVALPRFLQHNAIAAKGNKGHLEALLKLLKEVYLQGTDPAVLADVAAALAHLRAEDEARLHNVGAVLQAVVAELLGRLADAEGEGEGEGDEDADFNAGLVLLQLGSLAKRLNLGEFLGSGGDGGAGDAGGEDDAAEALAERVRGVVQARLAGAPTAWGKGFGQALEYRVRVVEEGMQLLYLLLLHSTRGLLRLAMERRPADGGAAGAGGEGGKPKPKKKGKKGSKGGADESEGEGEQEGDEDVGVEEAEMVLKQRKTLLAVLSSVLSLGAQEEAEAAAAAAAAAAMEDDEESQQSEESSQGGSGRRKKGKGKKGKGGPSEEVLKAVADVKTSAYALASDLRFLFRPGIGRYQVLRRVVWAPEPDFLRLLQGHFQREERRYQEVAARAEAQDKPEEVEAADAALVRELLDPLIRSVLYTTEALNRRQAAAIAAHFVHSGPRATESVKYLMKQLKDLDMRTYLEVHMTTLRSCFSKWADSDAGMDRFEQLAHRMAQTLGVGKISHAKQPQLLDSFVRFLKNGVQYATEEAPRRLPFLEGLQFYLSKLPDHKVRDVARVFEERTAALPPALQAQLEEERERVEEEPEALISEEGASFLRFQQALAAHLNPAGGGKGKGTPASSKRSPRSPRRSTGSSKKRARSRSRSTSRSRSPAPARRSKQAQRVSAAEALGHEDGDDEVDPIVMADSDEEEAEQPAGGRASGGRRGGSKAGRGRGRASAASTGLASVREGEEEDDDIEEEEEEGDEEASAGAGGKKAARASSKSQSQQQRGSKRRKVSAASQSSNLDAVDSDDEEASGGGGAGAGAQSDLEDSVFGDLGPSQKAAASAAADAGKGKKGKGRK